MEVIDVNKRLDVVPEELGMDFVNQQRAVEGKPQVEESKKKSEMSMSIEGLSGDKPEKEEETKEKNEVSMSIEGEAVTSQKRRRRARRRTKCQCQSRVKRHRPATQASWSIAAQSTMSTFLGAFSPPQNGF